MDTLVHVGSFGVLPGTRTIVGRPFTVCSVLGGTLVTVTLPSWVPPPQLPPWLPQLRRRNVGLVPLVVASADVAPVAAGGDREPVGQVGPDDFADRRDDVAHGERGGPVLRQVDVLVGVDAAAEVEVGAGEEAQVVLRVDAELEHRHGHRLHLATHPHLGGSADRRARCPGRDVDDVGRDQPLQALERPVGNRGGHHHSRRDRVAGAATGARNSKPGNAGGVAVSALMWAADGL